MRYEPEVISKNIEKSQKIKKWLIVILYLLLLPTILLSVILIALELGNSYEVPSFFDMEVYTITSESMSPRLKVNDVIIVKKGYEDRKYKIGNIITFRDSRGEIVTHRISKRANLGDKYSFVTKGDNNEIEDEESVTSDRVIGKVICTMPRLGKLVSILKNKVFFSFCIICLIAILLYDIRVKNRKISRKIIREKHEKKTDFYF